MTGRELILYILSNGLEDEPVVQNGKFVGFITAGEVAARLNVGLPTVYVWISQKKLDGVLIGDTMYIPANFKSPMANKPEGEV